MRLLIAYNVLALLVAMHYLLLTFDTAMFSTTIFFVVMWITSLLLLLWIRIYYGESRWLDYDEDPGKEGFTLWVLGLAAVTFLASLIPRIFAGLRYGGLYVPAPASALAESPFNLGSVASDVLFNLCLVANAEETLKLVSSLAIYHASKSEYLAVVVPVGFWAVLHAYIAYVGALMFPLVLAAFLCGIIIFYVLKRSKSLFLACLVHGGYNSLVLLLLSRHLFFT